MNSNRPAIGRREERASRSDKMSEADSLKFPNRNDAYVERHLEFPVSRQRKFRGFDTRQPHVAG